MVKITYKGESRNVPATYLKGLKGAERQKQIKSFFEKKDRPKTSVKSKESTWTTKFNNEVFKKGEGAYYSSGSRPNQTPQSWAYARMYSYILGGSARKVDAEITKKYNVNFPK